MRNPVEDASALGPPTPLGRFIGGPRCLRISSLQQGRLVNYLIRVRSLRLLLQTLIWPMHPTLLRKPTRPQRIKRQNCSRLQRLPRMSVAHNTPVV